MMEMNQFMKENGKKMLIGFIGFGIPLIFLAAQVFLGFGNLPWMMLMLGWFGFALLFMMGVSDE